MERPANYWCAALLFVTATQIPIPGKSIVPAAGGIPGTWRIAMMRVLWIAGRKKDMIISGAENIYPAEVERVITELDGVIEAAVVGVPDEEWGEAVAAYVVLAPGAALDQAAIVDHCRRNLAGYKKPRHVFLVESLPRTTVNKVSKETLRARFSR